MPNTWFQFKKFIVHQDRTAMKVGTDSVLLGAWSSVGGAKSILDVGAGNGIIALMMAQRSEALIDAVEIDREAFLQAQNNISISDFESRINVIHDDFIRFSATCNQAYDLIISNPPYFDNSLLSNDMQRNVARHDSSLDFEKLLKCSSKLLSTNGRLSLILPVSKERDVRQLAFHLGLCGSRSLLVSGKLGNPPKRILIEFANSAQEKEIKECISIFDSNHKYSSAYINLTCDFYMDF